MSAANLRQGKNDSMLRIRWSWFKSIRFQIGIALFLLFAVQAGSTSYTLYAMSLRRPDYEILNLASQMRAIAQMMINQSRNYLAHSPSGNTTYRHDTQLYYRNIQQHIDSYNLIITALRQRRLPPEFTGKAEPQDYNWNRQATSQLGTTSADWRRFRRALKQATANSQALRITAIATFIVRRGNNLTTSAGKLTQVFQQKMEDKLTAIRLFNWLALGVSALLLAVITAILSRNILQPLKSTVAGFSRVAKGDLGYQIPTVADNEIGHMTAAFNTLSKRLQSLFHLTDHINQGANLHDALRFIYQEFRVFLPVDWVGVLMLTPETRMVSLERLHSGRPTSLTENDCFPLEQGLPAKFSLTGQPLAIDRLAANNTLPPTALIPRLANDGMQSALYLPLGGAQNAVLLFASTETAAYTPEHLEFLTNLAGQLSHILEKTVVMEGLVIAAVEGLAKLAESRDPETGDHLKRMSLYAAIVSEKLGQIESAQKQITPAYVRDILHFAPMHDIGKVGIRDDILLKPSKLTAPEWGEMTRHPVIGGQVLRHCEAQMNNLGRSLFRVAIEIAEGHHEKFDGSGYPNGLEGDAIPLAARIVAVADVFDALTSKRPYKKAWPVKKALALLYDEAGHHFDPQIIAAFKQALPRILGVYKQFKHV